MITLEQRFLLISGRQPTVAELQRLTALQEHCQVSADDPTMAQFIAEMVTMEAVSKAVAQATADIGRTVDRVRDPLSERAAAEVTKQMQGQFRSEAGQIMRQLAAQAAQSAPAVAANRYLAIAGVVGLMLLTSVISGWTGLSVGAGNPLSSPFFKAYVEAGNDPSSLLPPADCKSAGLGGPSGPGSCWVSVRRAASSPVIPAEGSSPVALLPPAVQVAGLIALIIGFVAVGFWSIRVGGWWAAGGVFAALTCILFLGSLLPPTAWAAAWKVIWS